MADEHVNFPLLHLVGFKVITALKTEGDASNLFDKEETRKMVATVVAKNNLKLENINMR